MIQNISFSISHQLDQVEKNYKKEISALAQRNKNRDNLHELLYDLSGDSLKGNNHILPFYFILKKDYQMAWILLSYLNISFLYYENWYHPFAKHDLESPIIWDMKPISYREHEDKEILLRHGTTCFRLTEDYYPKAIKEMPVGDEKPEIYDISPEARHRTVDKNKNYYLSHQSFYTVSRLMEIYFRQEKIAETEECLFRLRHIASTGEPPKYLMGHPTARHTSAWVNMYDYWYRARHESDPETRKTLGWTALYWFLELGIRMAGNNNIDEFVHFSDGCEIIGEFELMGEDQENFLRHLKRFVMHASVSFCKKMMDNPIRIIPFSERNMPGYEEFQKIFRKFLDQGRS